MNEWHDHLTEDRRLVILRLLKEAGGSANESNLEIGLNALGHRRGVTREIVRADLRWLQDADLVTLEHFASKVVVASLTRRGLFVANGDNEVKGVKTPSII